MPVKPIPPDEPDKPNAKKVSQSNAPNERSRVTPYRWPNDNDDGSGTVPPGRSNRIKGDWMKR
jgi:hypothetical protein